MKQSTLNEWFLQLATQLAHLSCTTSAVYSASAIPRRQQDSSDNGRVAELRASMLELRRVLPSPKNKEAGNDDDSAKRTISQIDGEMVEFLIVLPSPMMTNMMTLPIEGCLEWSKGPKENAESN